MSALENIEELRAWKGEIWAINGVCQWLQSQGIDSFLFSVDPQPILATLSVGVKMAILASHVHAEVFAELKDADVLIFHSEHAKGAKKPLIGGSTSATRVPMVALMLGYRKTHFFGCEGSFGETTHTYKDEKNEQQVIISAGGIDYRTSLQMMVQSENLAKIIGRFANTFIDRSGGLLGAMIAYPEEWEVVAMSEGLRNKLDPTATQLYKISA